MKTARLCGCSIEITDKPQHVATDALIEASIEEIEAIRAQLGIIERRLSIIFGDAYSRSPDSLRARAEAAVLIDRHFDGIVDEWVMALDKLFEGTRTKPFHSREEDKADLENSLVRFIAHLRDPDDLRTYVYLRRHCQQGMLSRAAPSQFNTIHIALKQVILQHVRSRMRGHRMEVVRDAVVAAIDERRLMVSQFYIESRERALRASEEKYRSAIDHAPDPMYEIEPGTWRVLAINSAAERHWRLEPDVPQASPLGMSILDMETPEMRAGTLRHLNQVVANGSDQTLDMPIGPQFFDVHSALISYGNQSFIQMILRDVTQRREMMEELVKAEKLAAAGTFAAGIAHEVNNPLASISSLVQALLGGEAEPERKKTLHTILTQITRISGTLKDLVNFAKPSAVQRRALSLNDVVAETLRLVGYNRRFSGIAIEPQLAPDLKAVFIDSNEIQQVLLNLLFNAADATQGEGGVIRVITENLKKGDRIKAVTMRVADNGIGIPRESLERIFDPFFTTKPAGAGAGLGLSLCQRIILSNHGTIKAESEVGKGTTFTILLPVHEAHAEVHSAAAR